MESFLARTGVDEIMATSHLYDHNARVHSYEILAQVLGEMNAITSEGISSL